MASMHVTEISILELSIIVIHVEISMTRLILLLEIVELLYNALMYC
jgi:hypothetical protein